MKRLVEGRTSSRADWADDAHQGPRHDVGRLVHRPQGQPEEHQDLGRPAQAGRRGPHARTRSPRARRSGTCSPPTARRRTAARTRDGGPRLRRASCIKDHVKVQDKSGREALQNFVSGQRRRPALLRVRGDDRAEEGRGRRLRHARRHDQDRDPDRVTTTSKDAARRRRRSSTTCSPSPRRSSSPSWGYRPVNEAVLQANAAKFPEPPGPVHDRRPRRLVEGQRRALRPRERLDREDRGGRRECRRRSEHARRHRRGRAPRRSRRPRGAARAPSVARPGPLALGVVTLWLSLIVLLPLAAVVVQSLRRRPRRRSGTRSRSRQAVAALRFTLHRRRSSSRRSTRSFGHADRLGARPRRASAASAIVNALIDLPFALPTIVAGIMLLALYGNDEPGRHRRRLHAGRRRARAAVRDAAVRRALGPAGADRARPRDGGGRGRRSAPRALTIFRRIVLPNLRAGDPRRRGARVRPRGRRVRLDRPDLRATSRSTRRSRRSTSSSRSRATTPIAAAAVSVLLLAISLAVLFVHPRARALERAP